MRHFARQIVCSVSLLAAACGPSGPAPTPATTATAVPASSATSIEGDPRRAAELAKEFRARHPERIEGAALIALAWTRDALRGEPPADIKEVIERADALLPALRAVPHAAARGSRYRRRRCRRNRS